MVVVLMLMMTTMLLLLLLLVVVAVEVVGCMCFCVVVPCSHRQRSTTKFSGKVPPIRDLLSLRAARCSKCGRRTNNKLFVIVVC